MFWQENSCNSENIMLKLVAGVCRKYSFFYLKCKTLLVLDNATTQKTSKVKDKIKECETELSVIPNSLTWRLQTLDIRINKVLKRV